MSRPIAFFGALEGGQLLQALAGGSDAGVAITPRIQPRAIAFAGACEMIPVGVRIRHRQNSFGVSDYSQYAVDVTSLELCNACSFTGGS